MNNEELINENLLLKEELEKTKNELIETKEHLKKYTAPSNMKKYYENHFNEKFKLMVVTNNYFSLSATTLSSSNDVEQIDCPKLESLIDSFPVTIQDVTRHESQRLQKI